MKPILALLLLATFLVGMIFLVVSTTGYMHARNDPPAEPEQVLTAAGLETFAMYAPPQDPPQPLHGGPPAADPRGMRASLRKSYGVRGGPDTIPWERRQAELRSGRINGEPL